MAATLIDARLGARCSDLGRSMHAGGILGEDWRVGPVAWVGGERMGEWASKGEEEAMYYGKVLKCKRTRQTKGVQKQEVHLCVQI
jgi:hypothetical protein